MNAINMKNKFNKQTYWVVMFKGRVDVETFAWRRIDAIKEAEKMFEFRYSWSQLKRWGRKAVKVCLTNPD